MKNYLSNFLGMKIPSFFAYPSVKAEVAKIAQTAGGSVTAANITDATTTGRNVLKAADAAAARTAIGAGVPLVAATTGAIGGVKQSAAQANSTATDAAGIVTDFNALLAKLRTAGILAP